MIDLKLGKFQFSTLEFRTSEHFRCAHILLKLVYLHQVSHIDSMILSNALNNITLFKDSEL